MRKRLPGLAAVLLTCSLWVSGCAGDEADPVDQNPPAENDGENGGGEGEDGEEDDG